MLAVSLTRFIFAAHNGPRYRNNFAMLNVKHLRCSYDWEPDGWTGLSCKLSPWTYCASGNFTAGMEVLFTRTSGKFYIRRVLRISIRLGRCRSARLKFSQGTFLYRSSGDEGEFYSNAARRSHSNKLAWAWSGPRSKFTKQRLRDYGFERFSPRKIERVSYFIRWYEKCSIRINVLSFWQCSCKHNFL